MTSVIVIQIVFLNSSPGTKIPMTSPVLVEHVLLPGGKSNVTMSFMIPFKLQADPPLPTDATVSITRKPAMEIYVM